MSGKTEPRLTPGMAALREELIGLRQDSKVSVDTVRVAMAAKGFEGDALGGLFAEAKRRGWLKEAGSVPSTHISRKGGRVLVYKRQAIDRRGRGLHRDRQQPVLPLEGVK